MFFLCFIFQCCIDFKNNVLRIGIIGIEIFFLVEFELLVIDRLVFGEEGGYMEVEDKQLVEMEDKEFVEVMDRLVREVV